MIHHKNHDHKGGQDRGGERGRGRGGRGRGRGGRDGPSGGDDRDDYSNADDSRPVKNDSKAEEGSLRSQTSNEKKLGMLF